MYHIEQLRSKEIAELQSIAQELGIKGIKSLDRDSLIYRILDGQAMQNSKTGAPAVVKEENRMNRREHRRHRIHADAPSKVYTATGDKAVKLDVAEPRKAPVEAVAPAPQVKEVKPVEINYTKGDRVSHKKFGAGTIIDMVKLGADYKVTIRFDSGEEKNLMATFARLEKL